MKHKHSVAVTTTVTVAVTITNGVTVAVTITVAITVAVTVTATITVTVTIIATITVAVGDCTPRHGRFPDMAQSVFQQDDEQQEPVPGRL